MDNCRISHQDMADMEKCYDYISHVTLEFTPVVCMETGRGRLLAESLTDVIIVVTRASENPVSQWG